jgi:hypothetical protein
MRLFCAGRKTITAVLCIAAVCASAAGGAQVLRPTGVGILKPISGSADYKAMDLNFSVCDSLETLPDAWLELMDDLPDGLPFEPLNAPCGYPADSMAVQRMGRWNADLAADMTESLLQATSAAMPLRPAPPSAVDRVRLVAPQPSLALSVPGVKYRAEESPAPLPAAPLAAPEPGKAALAAAVALALVITLRRR